MPGSSPGGRVYDRDGMSDIRDAIDIRGATGDDADAFAALLRLLWSEAGPDAPGFAGTTDEIIEEMTDHDAVVGLLGDPRRRVHLAWLGTEPVGFSATRILDDDTVELAGIVVRRDQAGRGVGRRLVTASLEGIADQGCTRAVVRTETTNEAAQGFYRRLGFRDPIVTVEWVDGSAVDVVELTRPLG